MLEEYLALFMFPVLFIFLLSGFPVAFVLAGTALLFGIAGYCVELFYLTDLGFIPSRIFGVVSNVTLMAVPLFILMGMVLERSGLAEELLHTADLLLSKYRGGLAVGVVMVGALLAASTGIVGATVVTMTVLALPGFLARGYERSLACGTIATAGTLGQIIPPSILLVLLGDMMNVDVGDLFIGAILPGLILVGLYLIYILIRVRISPSLAPAPGGGLSSENKAEIFRKAAKALLPPVLLIVLVLGSILYGFASPTEAAGCGAAGAIVLAAARGSLTREVIREAARSTTSVTAMVFTLLIGAQVFSVVFRGLGGDFIIADIIEKLALHPALLLAGVLLLLFFLGFFLDFLEIIFIVVPIVTPILAGLGFNKLWLGILFAVNLQTSFLTPPFGFALFYLKGAAPPEVKTTDIYRGVAPFVVLQLIALAVIALYPGLVTYLPQLLMK